MRVIFIGLVCSSLGCAVRTGSGALSASNVPMAEGYMPKTRMKQTACSWRIMGLIPVGDQTRASELQARMARGSSGITDIVIENQNVNALLFSANCVTVSATPVTTGGNNG